jgi:glutathione synthase/RimK-type ligase-like ATP-grasp enzyme
LENWTTVKAFAVHVAEKFREIRFLGWDIALTEDGPAVIELNNSPDMGMIQDFYGGVRDGLHITPKDWWYQSKFTLKNQ